MSKYVVFLGGSGARCAEALCHLCMSGMTMDESEPIHLLLADADDMNGNTSDARTLLENYMALQYPLETPTSKRALARQKLDFHFWTIGIDLFGKDETGLPLPARLSTLNKLGDGDPQISELLMRALYTPSEMENEINKIGFFARPNVGASILRASILRDDDRSMETNRFSSKYGEFRAFLLDDLNSGQNVQVMLVGSVFGGTGASCMPGIAEDIQHKADQLPMAQRGRLSIGTTMLLPYFTLKQGTGARLSGIDSSRFSSAARVTLEYYHRRNTPFRKTYLLGLPAKTGIDETVRGGNRQNNHAMLLEWEAALAVFHFFSQENAPDGVYYKGCELQEDTSRLIARWKGFSQPNLNRCLGQYLRFCYFYRDKLRADINAMERGMEKKANFYLNYYERSFREQSGAVNEENQRQSRRMLAGLDFMTDRFVKWLWESLQEGDVAQEMVNLRLMEEIAAHSAILRERKVLGMLVEDGEKHADFNVVRAALDYASYGVPDTPGSAMGHLLQGVYQSCQ